MATTTKTSHKTTQQPKTPKPPKFHRDLTAVVDEHGWLKPSDESPLCRKCKLYANGPKTPYIEPQGAARPLLTIVTEGISKGEDQAGQLAAGGSARLMASLIEKLGPELGLSLEDVRWAPLTRCCSRVGGVPNYKTKGNWCRWHLVEDLRNHRPNMIMPVGTAALGALCHKSSAQDWGGRLLTYRGWPDDWFAKFGDGHPLFSTPTAADHVNLYPVQSPRLVYMTQNPSEIKRWRDQVRYGLSLAVNAVEPKSYTRPWWRLVTDVDEIKRVLSQIPAGTRLHFDTETNGLYPYKVGAKIVMFMFQWEQDGATHAIGFPWDYETSPCQPRLAELSPLVLDLLYRSRVYGHNLTFDILFVDGTVAGADLNRLTAAMAGDLWHMLYALKQERGSLGLELVAYDYAESLAGYEEEMVLLIDRDERLQPDKGGHYANCPTELWDSHLKPYVMGDVEVLAEGVPAVQAKLNLARQYKIPLAHPAIRHKFRWYAAPGRAWVYEEIMSKAARTLTRMTGRGMHVDVAELQRQEDLFPKSIRSLREQIKNVDPAVVDWCAQMEVEDPKWEFDLEKSEHLRTVLFDILKLPVKRLTKSGIQKYGEDSDNLACEAKRKYAAADKFTLNLLAAENPLIRPLLEYRKVHKAYTTYVRPMRNIFSEFVDKKDRAKEPYLMRDGCAHPSFNLCGTRGGRLSSSAPNAQNLPRDSLVKRMFMSRFGKDGCVMQFDLSQIELRLLAAACGDASMVKAYWDEIDIHSLTTSLIFKIPYEHFSKDYGTWLQERNRDKEAKELDLKRKIGKCVDPGTLISVEGRIARVGDVHAGRDPDTFYDLDTSRLVQAPSGPARLKRFYCNGDGEKVLIVARKGLLACSLIHRVKLADGRMVTAADLKPGDVLQPVQALESGHDESSLLPFDPFGKSPRSDVFKVHANAELAWFLGVFYGDGCSNAGGVAIATGGTPNYFGWQDVIEESASKLGFDPVIDRVLWDSTVDGPRVVKSGPSEGAEIKGACGRVRIGSVRVSDLFIQLGAVHDDDTRSRTLRVPLWLFNAANGLKRAFIAGWFDADGSVVRAGCLRGVTAYWQLAQDLSVLMRSAGLAHSVEPVWNKKYERWYFRLNANVQSSLDLRAFVRCPWKAERLRDPVYNMPEKANAVIQIIRLGVGPLVDLEVDREDHLYLQNGLIGSNTTNFLTGYGGGALGLQNSLANNAVYISLDECERIVDGFFDNYPALKRHIEIYKDFIMENAVAVSIFGRVRIFKEVLGDDRRATAKALRSGYNHLIQSTASDLMLLCLSLVEHLMREAKLESILISTVHDSGVVDVKRDELQRVYEICRAVIDNIPEMIQLVFGPDYDLSWCIVPLGGDFEAGNNYLDQRRVSGDNPDWDAILAHD